MTVIYTNGNNTSNVPILFIKKNWGQTGSLFYFYSTIFLPQNIFSPGSLEGRAISKYLVKDSRGTCQNNVFGKNSIFNVFCKNHHYIQ